LSERRSETFWVLDNNDMPKQSLGYECPPNVDIWWFPEFGFSTSQVWKDEQKAKAAARAKAEKDRDEAIGRLARLGKAP
jgi:hypothetical protein